MMSKTSKMFQFHIVYNTFVIVVGSPMHLHVVHTG